MFKTLLTYSVKFEVTLMDGAAGDTKARILASVLRMIEESGVASVTVRRVAADAQVNVAAVNYYFGNKVGLIRQALRGLMGDFFAAFDLLEGQNDPRFRLEAFLRAYISAALRYPDIVRSMVGLLISDQHRTGHDMEQHAAEEYEQFVRFSGMERITQVVGEITNRDDKTDIAMMAVQMMSSITMPLLGGQASRQITGVDLADSCMCDRYINLLTYRI